MRLPEAHLLRPTPAVLRAAHAGLGGVRLAPPIPAPRSIVRRAAIRRRDVIRRAVVSAIRLLAVPRPTTREHERHRTGDNAGHHVPPPLPIVPHLHSPPFPPLRRAVSKSNQCLRLIPPPSAHTVPVSPEQVKFDTLRGSGFDGQPLEEAVCWRYCGFPGSMSYIVVPSRSRFHRPRAVSRREFECVRRDVRTIRTFLLGLAGEDREGTYRPTFIRDLLAASAERPTRRFRSAAALLDELTSV